MKFYKGEKVIYLNAIRAEIIEQFDEYSYKIDIATNYIIKADIKDLKIDKLFN